jgi:hypothetical protein
LALKGSALRRDKRFARQGREPIRVPFIILPWSAYPPKERYHCLVYYKMMYNHISRRVSAASLGLVKALPFSG